MSDVSNHTGGCRCGAVWFEASAEPFYASYCHCGDCRRASGAPVAAFVGFYAADVRFAGEKGSTYGAAPIKRSFCATCGAPIAYTDDRIGDQIFFMLGAAAGPRLCARAIAIFPSGRRAAPPGDQYRAQT
jgi:hypothetical protein